MAAVVDGEPVAAAGGCCVVAAPDGHEASEGGRKRGDHS